MAAHYDHPMDETDKIVGELAEALYSTEETVIDLLVALEQTPAHMVDIREVLAIPIATYENMMVGLLEHVERVAAAMENNPNDGRYRATHQSIVTLIEQLGETTEQIYIERNALM